MSLTKTIFASAIVRQIAKQGGAPVHLDCRHIPDFAGRFPGIAANLKRFDLDPARDLIPVHPAAHYMVGGIRTDLAGRTDVPALYAVGEAAACGLHGANRLASNSLLEGLVFADRIAEDIARRLAAGELPPSAPARRRGSEAVGLLDERLRGEVQRAMTDGSGPVRSAESTAHTQQVLGALLAHDELPAVTTGAWETSNLAHLGLALTAAAHAREETRGGHERADFPTQDDPHWLGHLSHVRAGGDLHLTYRPGKGFPR